MSDPTVPLALDQVGSVSGVTGVWAIRATYAWYDPATGLVSAQAPFIERNAEQAAGTSYPPGSWPPGGLITVCRVLTEAPLAPHGPDPFGAPGVIVWVAQQDTPESPWSIWNVIGTYPTDPTVGSLDWGLPLIQFRPYTESIAQPDIVRLHHGSGPVCWDHDSRTYKVYSESALVFETPIGDVSETPTQLLAKDPPTGLPRWTDTADALHEYALKAEMPLDTGDRGTVPADDATIPDDPPAPTTLQTDKPMPPVAPLDPMVDTCPIMRCGAAYYLAQKLKEQYDLVRNSLLAVVAAPLLLRFPAADAPFGLSTLDVLLARLSDFLIGHFGADILWLTRVIARLKTWLRIAPAGLRVATDFEDLGEGGNTVLQQLAYPCLGCSENIFNLTQDMLVAWELAINADTTDFTEWQRHLLVYILQCTPFGIYHTVAAQGAAITSDSCGEW